MTVVLFNSWISEFKPPILDDRLIKRMKVITANGMKNKDGVGFQNWDKF